MRAYAVVKKPPVQSKEHVIRVMKNEPKIAIHSIQQNRITSPHKVMAVTEFHEINSRGSSYQIKGEEFKRVQYQQYKNKSNANKDEIQNLPLESSPKQPRTKRIFQEFQSGQIKEHQAGKIKDQNIKQNENFQTPVKVLNDDIIVEHEKSIQFSSRRRHHLFEPFGNNQSFRQNENIIFEAQEKQLYCCGEAKSEIKSVKHDEPKIQKKQEILQQNFVENTSLAIKKRKIFQQLPDKKIIQDILQQSTPDKIQQNNQNNEKEYKIKGKLSPIIESQNHRSPKIRIKIFEVSHIPIFDI